MNKRGQSIIEYTLIGMLIIFGIVIMGPYVIRSINAHFKIWDDQVQDSANEHPSDPGTVPIPPGCECSSAEIKASCGAQGKSITCPASQRLIFRSCRPANCSIIERCEDDSDCCKTPIRSACGNIPTSEPASSVFPNTAQCYYGQRRMINPCTAQMVGCVSDVASSEIDGDESCAPQCYGTIPVDPISNVPMSSFCPNTQQNLSYSMPISFVSDINACTTPINGNVPGCRMYCKKPGYQITSDGLSCEPVKECQTYTISKDGISGTYTAKSEYAKISVWAGGGGGAGGSTQADAKDGGGGGGGSLIEAYVKLIPSSRYYWSLGKGGSGGSFGATHGQNGENGGLSWFSSSMYNSDDTLNIYVDGGKGGAPNIGGLGGQTGIAKGVECFKLFKGGKGGDVADFVAGAGGGGGGGGAGMGGAGAGGGTNGSKGEGIDITLSGGAGGDGGYSLLTHTVDHTLVGGLPGKNPGGGGGGSGSNFNGGNGSSGQITICTFDNFEQERDKLCVPPCDPRPTCGWDGVYSDADNGSDYGLRVLCCNKTVTHIWDGLNTTNGKSLACPAQPTAANDLFCNWKGLKKFEGRPGEALYVTCDSVKSTVTSVTSQVETATEMSFVDNGDANDIYLRKNSKAPLGFDGIRAASLGNDSKKTFPAPEWKGQACSQRICSTQIEAPVNYRDRKYSGVTNGYCSNINQLDTARQICIDAGYALYLGASVPSEDFDTQDDEYSEMWSTTENRWVQLSQGSCKGEIKPNQITDVKKFACQRYAPYCPDLCGNGELDPGESCDNGKDLNGTSDNCCSSTCTMLSFKPQCQPTCSYTKFVPANTTVPCAYTFDKPVACASLTPNKQPTLTNTGCTSSPDPQGARLTCIHNPAPNSSSDLTGIPTCFECLSQPANAIICPNDNMDLTSSNQSSVVVSCTSQKKCEFICMSGHTKSGNTCVPNSTPPDNCGLGCDMRPGQTLYCSPSNCTLGQVTGTSGICKMCDGQVAYCSLNKAAISQCNNNVN